MFFPLSAVGASCSLFLNLYEIFTWSMLPNTKEAELQKLMDFGCVGDVSCGSCQAGVTCTMLSCPPGRCLNH